MFLRRLFLLAAIFIAVSGNLFAQYENEDLLTKDINDLAKASINPFHSNVMPFMTESDGSWLVLVTKQGGIAGGYHLIAAITSDGKAVCKEKDEYKAYPLKDDIKLGLFDTVSRFKFAELKPPSKKNKDDYTKHCNDCFQTSMEVFHRETKKNFKTYSFDMDVLDDSDASKLFARIVDSYECPPLPSN